LVLWGGVRLGKAECQDLGSRGVKRVPRCSECGRELPGPFLRQDGAILCPDCWQGQFVDGEEAYRHLQTCKACRKAFEVAFNYLRTCPPECRRFFRHWLKKLAEDPPRAK